MDNPATLDEIKIMLAKSIDMQILILKSLHLLPTTEKEEIDIQIRRRESEALSAKISENIEKLTPSEITTALTSSMLNLHEFEGNAVYDTVLGSEFAIKPLGSK